ncbi:Ig-like protein [Leptospira inadai serovar Lyme str. 10]|uniref:Ig-like protein n=2 Tax=Leptospira inadai serovar Lyme TaxID=293084 RepID=V6HDK9_9LEPT|nr:Ig-like domain-containing protein [Leptospira inadai]EQA38241.1 Ig-like protein [Leptospira inadai serovar Lyme str. 10]PNV74001.1 Ig-like protein [Leptospira inadai serovar Lyme]
MNRFRLLTIVSVSSIAFLFFRCGNDPQKWIDRISHLGLASTGEFESPRITFASPGLDQREISIHSDASLLFSQPMDKNSVESGITVLSVGGNNNVRFEWVSDVGLRIIFRNGMTPGKRYEIRLNRSVVKDIRGNFLKENFITNYYTEGFGPSPYVTGTKPPNINQITYNVSVNTNPEINFSESMDVTKTNDAITLSGGPALFIRQWSPDGKKITLTLTKDLALSTTYTLRISKNASSSKGVALDRDYAIIFYTGAISSAPYLTDFRAVPNSVPIGLLNPSPQTNEISGISKNDFFEFAFSGEMNREKTQSAIQFVPSIAGQYLWATPTLLRFTPSARLDQDRTYRMTIAQNAESIGGLPLRDGYIVDLTVNRIVDSGAILLNSITGYSVSSSCLESADGNANVPSLPLDPDRVYKIDVLSTGCALMDYKFKLSFSAPGGCPLKTFGDGDIYNQISVSYFAGGPSTGSPSTYYKQYNGPNGCTSTGTFEFGLKNIETGIQYKILIRGGASGIKDTNENRLPQDYIFLFERGTL